jgi:predicted nucleic acid-binding Zn ribbon protein
VIEPQTSGGSGVDMARAAFRAAREAAKNQLPKATRPKRQTKRRGADGRDPIALGGAITGLLTDRGWEAPTAGGNILDQWPTLCPDLAATVQPVHYDPEHGRLDLRPASHAYAAQLRLLGPQLAQRINDKLGTTAVRTIRVLAPGPVAPAVRPAAAEQASAECSAEPPRVRTRDDASPGYHEAFAAINRTPLAGQKPRLERHWGTGEYAHLREAPDRFTDAVAALETAAQQSGGNTRDAVRQAAIKRARASKAGNAPAATTVFQRTA